MTPARDTQREADSPRVVGEVDVHEVLERVAALPISSWSYMWDDGTVRHIGPMAQDFYDAFGLGSDNRRIDPVDGLGVALAATQALYELVCQQATEIAELRSRIDRLASSGSVEAPGRSG